MCSFDEIAQLGRGALDLVLGWFPTVDPTAVIGRVDSFVDFLDREMRNSTYNVLSPKIIGHWQDMVAASGGDEGAWASALLATLLVRVPVRAVPREIPPELVQGFCEQLRRIAIDLNHGATRHMRLGDDLFLKDLGIARLEVFPCKSLLVEKNSGVPRKLAFSGGIGQTARFLRLMASTGGRLRPYFEIHAHTPMLREFNEAGWDYCYRQVALLLRRYPEYRGLVGGSWFFDPEVPRISPHLGYLIRRPREGGAVFFRGHSSRFDVDNATATSARRRELYEQGKYLPMTYVMVWPRTLLLAWSEGSGGRPIDRLDVISRS